MSKAALLLVLPSRQRNLYTGLVSLVRARTLVWLSRAPLWTSLKRFNSTTTTMEGDSAINTNNTDSVTAEDVQANLGLVRERLQAAYDSAPPSVRAPALPRLVAVSKTKPPELVIAAYAAGQRDFGENYIDKLIERAQDERLTELCPEIRWRFIGTLQSKRINPLLKKCTRLSCIETVSSLKVAEQLNQTWGQLARPTPLSVLVQVNTSHEDQKGGLTSDDAIELAIEIEEKMDSLRMDGFMTIGSLMLSTAAAANSTTENADFLALIETKRRFCARMQYDATRSAQVELSMGMSADFELAARMGSTNVRVGTTIFGRRQMKMATG